MHAEEEKQFPGKSQGQTNVLVYKHGSQTLRRRHRLVLMYQSTQVSTTCLLGKRQIVRPPDRLLNHKRARPAPPARYDTQKLPTQAKASKSDDKEGAQGYASLAAPVVGDQHDRTTTGPKDLGIGLKAAWYGAEQFGNIVGLRKKRWRSDVQRAPTEVLAPQITFLLLQHPFLQLSVSQQR